MARFAGTGPRPSSERFRNSEPGSNRELGPISDRRPMVLALTTVGFVALVLLIATIALSGGADPVEVGATTNESTEPQAERFLFYVEGVDIDLIRAEAVDLTTHRTLDEGGSQPGGEPPGIRLTLRSSEVIERVVVAQNLERLDADPGILIDVADVVLPESVTIDAYRICVSQAGSPGLSAPGELDPAINEISANGWNPTGLVDFLDSTGGINLVVDQVWIDASQVEMDWIYSSLPATVQMTTERPELPPPACDQ